MRVINRKVLVHSLLWLSPLMLTGVSAAESKEHTSTTEFKLSSPTLTENGAMPVSHTCDGSRAVPEISWSSVPAGTQSLAMVMHHEAGPSDVHVYWVVYDIDPDTTHLGADVGSATLGVNTVDSQPTYTPPCSRGPGVKWYDLTLYALSEAPNLRGVKSVTGEALWQAMEGITLATANLHVSYDRYGTGTNASTGTGAGTNSNSNNPRCKVIRQSVTDAGFDDVSVSCDQQYAYVTSDTYPDHSLMTGISGTNEQVPVPAPGYAAPIPLEPKKADKVTTIDAAVGVAVNGVPIYDYSSQGELDPTRYDANADTVVLGQLDNCGGHSGRGDDYHYHKSPNCMIDAMANAGDDAILGWGYDGYPLYGDRNPDGSDIAGGDLDICNGQADNTFGYRYHTSDSAPYIIQCLVGKVDTRSLPRVAPLSGDTQGIRANLRPPRDGVTNLTFTEANDGSRTMRYQYRGESYYTTYKPSAGQKSCYDFEQKTISNNGRVEQGTFCRTQDRPNQSQPNQSQPNQGRPNPGQTNQGQPNQGQPNQDQPNRPERNAQGNQEQQPQGAAPNGSMATLGNEITATFGKAMAAQVKAGDGNGIDMVFRNSGVLIDADSQSYFAVNGVHPVKRDEYGAYYPKSIIQASLATDRLIRAYPFESVRGHDIDMEALSFGPKPESLYIGDEYNYIYRMSLADGAIEKQWNLADIGVHTRVDKGIEAMTWSATTGYFYVGIQDSAELRVLELADNEKVTEVDRYRLPPDWSASGMNATADRLLVLAMNKRGQTAIFQYGLNGQKQCDIQVPDDLPIVRADGLYLDVEQGYVYIADSQGPLKGGSSLYQLRWTDPCGQTR